MRMIRHIRLAAVLLLGIVFAVIVVPGTQGDTNEGNAVSNYSIDDLEWTATFDVITPPPNPTVPASGGTMSYTVSLDSDYPNTIWGCRYHTYAYLLDDGPEYGPIEDYRFPYTPGAPMTFTGTATIPGDIPDGQYRYDIYIDVPGHPRLLHTFFYFSKHD